LLERCMGNVAFVEKILGKFRDQSAEVLSELVKGVAARDAALAYRTAHTLKGSAANLSAVPLQESAARIEQLARDNDFAAVEQEINDLRRELDRCIAYMPKALGQLADK
jgi:HPt (histidine-containing phosphotransfer) domain-containing protein